VNDHPATLTTERRRAALPPADTSLQEMQELIEISSLGSPVARRLRALADPALVDRFVEAHMGARAMTATSAAPSPPSPPASPPPAAAPSPGTEWMAHGNCASETPASFFPSDGVGVEVARRICQDCPVKQQCLEFALTNRVDHGVWGGTSERERRRILKRRRLAHLASLTDQ